MHIRLTVIAHPPTRKFMPAVYKRIKSCEPSFDPVQYSLLGLRLDFQTCRKLVGTIFLLLCSLCLHSFPHLLSHCAWHSTAIVDLLIVRESLDDGWFGLDLSLSLDLSLCLGWVLLNGPLGPVFWLFVDELELLSSLGLEILIKGVVAAFAQISGATMLALDEGLLISFVLMLDIHIYLLTCSIDRFEW